MTQLKEINIILGQKIRETRRTKGITREQLAESIQVSPRFLADVEAGKTGVSLSTLKNLCSVLDVSSDHLLGISVPEKKEIYINSIKNKIKQFDEETLENIDKIIENITRIYRR
ncbi:MAG: helix-turn-helix domain-containing protein [Firmicutes bacterium]|nr:helix-turn-helix domain-containing protein [Bacillota bacterium]